VPATHRARGADGGSSRRRSSNRKTVSRSLLAHWNGTRWTHVLGAAGTSLTQVTSDGAGGIWVQSDYGTVRHRTAAGVWTEETLTQPAGTKARVYALALRPGTSNVWAVGATITDATGYADLAHWRGN
jgi:hypothetical protein